MFPLHYRGPYPITRGIKVETAAIFIIFLLGVMSQMKVWKVIKKRREQRTAEHIRREHLRDQAEEDLGRKLEEGNQKERTAWEAAYNGQHTDSGVASVNRVSLSNNGTNHSVELDDLSQNGNDSHKGSKLEGKDKSRATVTVHVASEDEIASVHQHLASDVQEDLAMSQEDSRDEPSPAGSREYSENTPREDWKRLGRGSPNVVPLPFNVPDADSSGDRRSSVAASIVSERFTTRVLKRLSGSSPKRSSSKKSQRSFIATSTSEEAIMLPQVNDDWASSIAATVDNISDGPRSDADTTTLAGLPSPFPDMTAPLKFSPPAEPHPTDRPGRKISELSLGQTSSDPPVANEGQTGQATGEDGLKPSQEPTLNIESTYTKNPIGNGMATSVGEIPGAIADTQPVQPALSKGLAELQGASKVVMAYRTNEWAKHLDAAEKPMLEEPRTFRNQQPPAHPNSSSEKVAPVNVTALQQTPLNAEPAPSVTLPKLSTSFPQRQTTGHSSSSKSSESLSKSPNQQSQNSPLNFDRTPSQTSLDSLPSQRGPSKPVIRRGSPQTSKTPNTRNYQRSSAGPMLHSHLVESPIEEGIPTVFPQRKTPPISTANTLMAQRQSMMQTRASSTSLLTRIPSNPSLQAQPLDDLRGADDLPLTHRKSLIEQHRRSRRSSQPLSPSYQTSSPSNSYPYPLTHRPSFPSQSTATITQWRASLQQPVTEARYSAQDLDNRHSELLNEKRRGETEARQKEMARGRR